MHTERSPLSRAIEALEEELGVRLCIRNSRSTRQSWSGQVFNEHVPRIFTACNRPATEPRRLLRNYTLRGPVASCRPTSGPSWRSVGTTISRSAIN
nr:LysR family transcriptional regulator [Comamonas koreensis]